MAGRRGGSRRELPDYRWLGPVREEFVRSSPKRSTVPVAPAASAGSGAFDPVTEAKRDRRVGPPTAPAREPASGPSATAP